MANEKLFSKYYRNYERFQDKDTGLYGYYFEDANNQKHVIPAKYIYAGEFSGGIAPVFEKGDKFLKLINTNGETLAESNIFNYDEETKSMFSSEINKLWESYYKRDIRQNKFNPCYLSGEKLVPPSPNHVIKNKYINFAHPYCINNLKIQVRYTINFNPNTKIEKCPSDHGIILEYTQNPKAYNQVQRDNFIINSLNSLNPDSEHVIETIQKLGNLSDEEEIAVNTCLSKIINYLETQRTDFLDATRLANKTANSCQSQPGEE